MVKVLVFGFIILTFPFLVSAQDQLVSCGGLDCSICSLLETVSLVFNWGLGVTFALASLFIIIGGFMYTGSIGREDKMHKARKLISYSLFGFFTVLTSFLAIHLIFYLLGAENKGNWHRFKCSESLIQENVKITRNNPSVYIKNDNAVVDSNSIAGILQDEKKIIKLNKEGIDPVQLAKDILSLYPRKKINFITADEEASKKDIINFRNVNFGFNENIAGEYKSVQRKSSDFLGDSLSDPNNSIQDIITFYATDAGIAVEGSNDYTRYSGDYVMAEGGQPDFEELIRILAEKLISLINQDIYVYSSDRSPEKLDFAACSDTGGEWVKFQNECLLEKEEYDNEDLKCSDIYNPIWGCECPEDSYLVNQKCVKSKSGKDEDKDNVPDTLDMCFDTFTGAKVVEDPKSKYFGCSCSQIPLGNVECPSTRCEGDDLVTYPESGKGKCIDNSFFGVVLEKSNCEPIDIEHDNPKCIELNELETEEEKEEAAKEDKEFYEKTKDSYDDSEKDKSGDDKSSKGGDSGSSSDSNQQDLGSGGDDNQEATPPRDLGPGEFNSTASFRELAECLNLKKTKDKDGKEVYQIPYNGIIVVLLNPNDPLNRRTTRNNSKAFYMSRKGELFGHSGQRIDTGGQGHEYGARDFHKGTSNSSMWGVGWKATPYGKYRTKSGGWTDECSFGQLGSPNGTYGFKIGNSSDSLNPNNLAGGKVTSVAHCGQHAGNGPCSSAGCALLGSNKAARCSFVNTIKKHMSGDKGVLQVHLLGEKQGSKLVSSQCRYVNICGAIKSFKNSKARILINDPNKGYPSDDKRRVQCPSIGISAIDGIILDHLSLLKP